MYVQLICKDRTNKEKDELYEVLGALALREQVQIEERGDMVEIDACPQGKIQVYEDGRDVILTSNTRHAGPGFHAFVVDFFQDIQQELPGDYEMMDELEFDKDGDFHRIVHRYQDEIEYLRGRLLKREPIIHKNYIYDETYYLPLEKEGFIATPIGYLDEKEFRKMDAMDLMDVFYVWNAWDHDALYFKNAALTLLAKEGYDDFILMNEHTEKVASTICDYIELAYEKDPTLPLPMKTYRRYCEMLGRQNRIEKGNPMREEEHQYRSKEVYHLFRDAKIVAPGTAERSYDPSMSALCLMSPFTDEADWSWLMRISFHDGILENPEALSQVEPIEYQDKTIWMYSEQKTGYYVLDAKLKQDEREMYFHVTVRHESDMNYLKQCIKESGFQSLD